MGFFNRILSVVSLTNEEKYLIARVGWLAHTRTLKISQARQRGLLQERDISGFFGVFGNMLSTFAGISSY